jgi:hypothetical protein
MRSLVRLLQFLTHSQIAARDSRDGRRDLGSNLERSTGGGLAVPSVNLYACPTNAHIARWKFLPMISKIKPHSSVHDAKKLPRSRSIHCALLRPTIDSNTQLAHYPETLVLDVSPRLANTEKHMSNAAKKRGEKP